MPVSTISRWPCATRRRTSSRTAAALRLRDRPRTRGMTQKLQEKLQPSWIFTKAPLADLVRIGVRHVAAEEADGERRHGGMLLGLADTESVGPVKIGGPAVARDTTDMAERRQ